MKISVIIPVFNGAKYLVRAIESVVATGYSDLEIIVVDDGSQDNSFQVAEECAGQHQGLVSVLRHPKGENRGVAASRNLGITHSKGDFVAFLDADDYYEPCRFDVAVELFAQDDTVDAVYERSDMVFESEDAKARWGFVAPSFGLIEPLEGVALLAKLLTGQVWATSTITIRRTFFERVGCFPENSRIAEDCNLWFRMAALGRVVSGQLEQPVSAYFRHAENTYYRDDRHRIAMIYAMASAFDVARKKEISSSIQKVFEEALMHYVHATLVVSIEHEQKVSFTVALWKNLLRTRSWPCVFRFSILRLSMSALWAPFREKT